MTENVRTLGPQEVLFCEGDAADCAFVIESGELEISTHFEGEKVIICHLGEGDIVGETGVVDSSPRTASATATRETRLMVVTRNQLTERIAEADPVLKLLVRILLERRRVSRSRGDAGMEGGNDELLSEELVGEYIRHGIDKISLEAELKDALATGQLEVFYQPLLDVATRKIAGFEALTRWHHPKRGHISPGLFITLAEETKLIAPVGLYVFEHACRALVQFEEEARANNCPFPLFMAINVSGRQIADPEFIGKAAALTSRLGIPREQIKLEITESLAVDFEATESWIERAHEHGFQVSLDDFGTGYSSLDNLSRLALDTAKIDRAFVEPLEQSPRSRELFRGIVAMMRGLGLKIVVEGIEKISQLEFISALGCHYAQGYLIDRSVDLDAALRLIRDGPDLVDVD